MSAEGVDYARGSQMQLKAYNSKLKLSTHNSALLALSAISPFLSDTREPRDMRGIFPAHD